MNVKVFNTKIDGVLIFQTQEFSDHRGYLIESYNESEYKNFLPSVNFIQDNESKSSYGVLRGLHYQDEPYPQAKLVRVVKGEIQDVAVDLRKDSPTYLQYVSVNLSHENKKQLYIPRGFGHGFLVLSQEAIVCYKIDNIFNLDCYKGLKYNDPKINIDWQLSDDKIILSDKDRELRYLP
tara:strand:- start:1220 stop:1756 length:537 start_codon:yes stop_codon:yes gene_type:complete